MNDGDAQKVIDEAERLLREMRARDRKEEEGRRRAAIFRKLGVHTPRALLGARAYVLHRKFDGRGMRRRDRLALGVLNWVIDRCQMLEIYGELGDVFHWRE